MEEAEAIRRVAGALLTGGGAIGVGIGVGLITAKYLEGIARQPELQPYLFTQLLIGMGLVDAIPIVSLAIGLLFLDKKINDARVPVVGIRGLKP